MMMIFIGKVNAEYTVYKEHSIIKQGDTIYFDATDLDWTNVYIHIWEQGGTVYKEWSNDDEMIKVENTDNIYKFTVPNDIEEKYNMVIFHNVNGGNANQTISLSYIEDKFAYVVNGFRNEKRRGYWYLYDKSELQEHLDQLKEYQKDKEFYTASSYGNLDEIITNIEGKVDGEIKLEKDESTTNKYYILVEVLFNDADIIIDSLIVDPTILSDLIEETEENLLDDEEKYTKDSVDELKKIIEEKRDLLESDNITIDDLKRGIDDINNALDKLEEQADKEQLIKELDEVSKLDKTKYDDDSYNELERLLEEAKTIKDDTNVSQDEVDEIVLKIKNAKDSLKEKENEIVAPKTLDDIVKVFIIFGISIVAFVVILFFMKKNKKNN